MTSGVVYVDIDHCSSETFQVCGIGATWTVCISFRLMALVDSTLVLGVRGPLIIGSLLPLPLHPFPFLCKTPEISVGTTRWRYTPERCTTALNANFTYKGTHTIVEETKFYFILESGCPFVARVLARHAWLPGEKLRHVT